MHDIRTRCTISNSQSVDDARDENRIQVPSIGYRRRCHAILGQSNHGTVVKDCQNNDQDGREIPIVDHCDQTECKTDTEGHRDRVSGVCGHTLENHSCSNDGTHDRKSA